MIKKILMPSIVCVLVLFISINVKAATFTDNQVVDANKSWTIHFNQEVSFDDLTKSGILVTDSKGNVVNVTFTLGSDNKSIIVNAPSGGYTQGGSYTLTVGKKAHSIKGKSLNQEIVEHFSIKSSETEKQQLTWNEIWEKTKNVVTVQVYNKTGYGIASGIGFVIDSDGTNSKIVTDCDILSGGYSANVITGYGDNRKYYSVEGVYGYDKASHMAILKVNARHSEFSSLSLGDSNLVKLGDKVYEIGDAYSPERMIGTSINKIGNSSQRNGYNDFQIKVDFYNGIEDYASYGAPLFNEYGEVIGIMYYGSNVNAQSANDKFNLDTVIPINDIKKFINITTLKTVEDVGNNIPTNPNILHENVPYTPTTPSIPTNPSIPVNTGKCFPLLSDVPQPNGLNYVRYDKIGDDVIYFYNDADVPNNFVTEYVNLLESNGWSYFKASDDRNTMYFNKGLTIMTFGVMGHYVEIGGNIH